MNKPIRRQLIVFDFDETILSVDSLGPLKILLPRDQVLEKPKNGNIIGWVNYNNEILRRLHNSGFTNNELRDVVRATPAVPGMLDLLRYLFMPKKPNVDVVVVSDANDMFLNDWMVHHNFTNCCEAMFANPIYELTSGGLMMRPYDNYTDCPYSPPNLCKRRILEQFLYAQQECNICYERIIYVGDGNHDFCPLLILRKTDIACVRAGFPLDERVKQYCKKKQLRPRIVHWNNGCDLLCHFKADLLCVQNPRTAQVSCKHLQTKVSSNMLEEKLYEGLKLSQANSKDLHKGHVACISTCTAISEDPCISVSKCTIPCSVCNQNQEQGICKLCSTAVDDAKTFNHKQCQGYKHKDINCKCSCMNYNNDSSIYQSLNETKSNAACPIKCNNPQSTCQTPEQNEVKWLYQCCDKCNAIYSSVSQCRVQGDTEPETDLEVEIEAAAEAEAEVEQEADRGADANASANADVNADADADTSASPGETNTQSLANCKALCSMKNKPVNSSDCEGSCAIASKSTNIIENKPICSNCKPVSLTESEPTIPPECKAACANSKSDNVDKSPKCTTCQVQATPETSADCCPCCSTKCQNRRHAQDENTKSKLLKQPGNSKRKSNWVAKCSTKTHYYDGDPDLAIILDLYEDLKQASGCKGKCARKHAKTTYTRQQ